MRRNLKNLISACLQKLGVLTCDPDVREELSNTIQKGERALELRLLQKNQSEIDKNQAEAAAALLNAIPDDTEAVLRIGSILIIRYLCKSGKYRVLVRTLTQRELMVLEKNPRLASDPRIILKRLSGDAGGGCHADSSEKNSEAEGGPQRFPALPP